MQPILAESAPHRGRAVGFAAALVAITAITAIAVLAVRPAPSHHRHRQLHLQRGKCMSAGYVYIVR